MLSSQAFALVDYTESSSFKPKNSGARRIKKQAKAPSTRSTTQVSRESSSSGRSGFFSTEIGYQTDEIKLGEYTGNISRMGIKAHFETPYNIFLDARYEQAKLSGDLTHEYDSEQSGYQSGNPEVMVGFNWLEFGSPMEAAHIDLLAGLRFGQNNSDFATQRTDKVVGISTAKRFYNFALGLGYQMILTDSVDRDGETRGELAIGNISRLTASLGWVVSSDIRFLVEANSYTIGSSSDDISYKLDEEVKVSVISPEVVLGISPLVDLSLGAHLSSRRLQNEKVLGAKLWNIDGLYGNSLYVNMGINL